MVAAIEDEQVVNENDDDFLSDSPEQLAAKRAHFAPLNKLLTSTVLGTS